MNTKKGKQINSYVRYLCRKNEIDGKNTKQKINNEVNNLLKENNVTPEEYITSIGFNPFRTNGGIYYKDHSEKTYYSDGQWCGIEDGKINHFPQPCLDNDKKNNFPSLPKIKFKTGLTKTAKQVLDQKFPSQKYIDNYNRIFNKS